MCLETGKTPAELLQDLWQQTGRSFYCRHDYEGVVAEKANELIDGLSDMIPDLKGREIEGFTVEHADVFSYRDEVDQSESHNQGIRIFFADGSRIVFRLSGTGTDSATIRVYLERLQMEGDLAAQSAEDATRTLGDVARELSRMTKITGMTEPTVIT
jgi:phosphoglucomutase